MQIAAYVRVSTDGQNEQRQMHAIREKYGGSEQNNESDWYCDLGESGASTSRWEYQRLRKHVAEYDVVVAHELDRLGWSFSDLAGFVKNLREKGVDIDLVNQPIGTVGEDDWMAEMMLNMMIVFAEHKMIRSRVQEGHRRRHRRRQAHWPRRGTPIAGDRDGQPLALDALARYRSLASHTFHHALWG